MMAVCLVVSHVMRHVGETEQKDVTKANDSAVIKAVGDEEWEDKHKHPFLIHAQLWFGVTLESNVWCNFL